ncbi:hypothetical protein GeomeDRAFT_0425 [Geobacter metallireducens RCH3]|uniref:Chromosome segregation ATPase n=1 Tax=Geobacter metallireducens (strain ATCC 53774 / DSM 7210 / GS-15) TaxID=269799 RepID=Q39SA1_GEOMG|nr:hypothetical protein [Geobacter metallireducens]ABB32873.1 hypothetical protein Gmet_2655 [Geobacter metallireducens GS-15]EHP88993.1 hypothetical protein GeomeDRAFT_0425 [Geobacter metallireducens RCH3]
MLRLGSLLRLTPVVLLLLSAAAGPQTALAGFEVDCKASARAYADQGIPCYCRGGRIECDQPSGGGSYGSSPKSGLSFKNQMKLQIMQSITDMAANAFINWLNGPSPSQQSGPTPQQIAEQKAAQERAAAEWRAKVEQQIREMESQYEQQKKQEFTDKKKKLLAGIRGLDASSPGRDSHAFRQLRCSAYWGGQVARALAAGDEKRAEEYRKFSEKPTGESMARCDKEFPEPPMPDGAVEVRMGLYQTMIEEVHLRLPMIEQAKEKQRNATEQVAEKQKKVEELKSQATTLPPAEKEVADDLLAQALKELDTATTLKNEADAGVKKLELEIDALNEVGKLATAPKAGQTTKGSQP